MTSVMSPKEWERQQLYWGVFLIILLIGTIILFALGYISWKVFAGLFILVIILSWMRFSQEYSIPEMEFPDEDWDEEE